MTLRTYRRIFRYLVVALIGVLVLAILGTLALGSGCRGEGCGWVLLVPIFWGPLLLPPLAAVLLVGFAICSAFRFRDIGLSRILGAVPALLLPRTVIATSDAISYPTLMFRSFPFALNVIPVCCTAICLYLLFFMKTGHLAEARAANPRTYRSILVCAALLIAVGMPYAALDFSRLFGRGMFLYDGFFNPAVLYSLTLRFPALYYLYVLLATAVAAGLLVLIRRRPANGGGTSPATIAAR